MSEQLFVYGTLMLPEVQQKVFGRVTTGQPDRLDGYWKSSITLGDKTYPIAVKDEKASMEGVVLSLTIDELARVDRYEGREYRRVRVKLVSGSEAWVYCEQQSHPQKCCRDEAHIQQQENQPLAAHDSTI